MTDLPDNGALAWLHKYARRNYWRVAAWMDYDDLIQDGYREYYEVRFRYPNATQPAHIMSLFKLTMCSKLEDLVRQNTKQIDDARSDIVEVFDGDAVALPDPSTFNLLLIKAPKLVRDTIMLLANDKQREVLNKPYDKQANGRRETFNERICSLLGLDANKNDVVKEVRQYFAAA